MLGFLFWFEPLHITRVIGVASLQGMYFVGLVYSDGTVEKWDAYREPTIEDSARIMAVDKALRITVIVPACELVPEKLSIAGLTP